VPTCGFARYHEGHDALVNPFRRRPAPPPAADVQVYPQLPTRPAGPRLLVCDDNQSVTQLLEMMFEQAGWTVDVTDNGADAVASVALDDPDVVLLDQQLGGGLTGVQAAQTIRKAGYERPIVLFSAFLDEKTRRAAERLGLLQVSKVDFPAVVRHVTEAHARARV
jgi:CheY-like chemotaxis protein